MVNLEFPHEVNVPLDVKKSLQDLFDDKKYGFLRILTDKFPWEELSSYHALLKNYDQVAIIGIGGSSQGSKSIINALEPGLIDQKFVYFDRIDEDYLARQISRVKNKDKTAWFVNSKSGSTTETLFILNSLLEKTEGLLFKNKKNVFVVTENEDSVLGEWAERENLEVIRANGDIEGRFSVFSSYGLMPITFLYQDFALLKKQMTKFSENFQVVEQLSAFYLDSFRQQKWISNIWLYTERLREFGFWLEQIWAESLGKYKDESHRVSTPFCCLGTNDQHSLLQQMEEGFPDKSQLFIQIEPMHKMSYNTNWISERASYLNSYQLDSIMNKYCKATYESLQGNPRALLTLKGLSLESVLALHMVFALTIGTIGKNLDVEIYGQPGVEKSKQLFRHLLKE
ncbi:MAG: hypothetical protein KDD58_10215 [Bdellovibrionales bacterium]|nr:hypothetical protein [Bdellovibrionales bacterium]